MSNTLLKYINNKGLGSGIDDVQWWFEPANQ